MANKPNKPNKPNKLTSGSNLLWEGSRMIIPEHKIAMLDHRQESTRRQRAVLDEQAWEEISAAVAESMDLRKEIKLRLYHPFEEVEIIGIVDRVDQHGSRFMVDGEWFKIGDIEGVKKPC
jgi:hypothetical protein